MTAEHLEGPPPMEALCNRDNPCEPCTRDTTFDGAPRCTAWSSQRHHRCDRARTPGTVVCASHGSKSPQVKRRAQLRLLELVDPAIAVLAQEMVDQKNKSSDRQRAANSLLDRAGIARRTEVDHGVAQQLLVERIRDMLARRDLDALPAPDDETDVVDAVVIESPDERMEA